MPIDHSPAYPTLNPETQTCQAWLQHGMDLRDWFAGQALMGLCANDDLNCGDPVDFAKQSYGYADAMMERRIKP